MKFLLSISEWCIIKKYTCAYMCYFEILIIYIAFFPRNIHSIELCFSAYVSVNNGQVDTGGE